MLHFFTGTHPDYHRPTDKAARGRPGGGRAARRGAARPAEVAQDQHHGHGPRRRPGRADRGRHRRKPRPAGSKYVEVKGNARVERQGSRPYFGSIPDFGSEVKALRHPRRQGPGSPSDKRRPQRRRRDHRNRRPKNQRRPRRFRPGPPPLRAAGETPSTWTATRAGKEVKLKVTLGVPR